MPAAVKGGDALACGARWDGPDLVLTVRVVPRASADAVLGETDCLKVRLTAPPVDGKANERLCRVLGKLFGVARSRVTVERGASSRVKQVRIAAPERLPELLHAGAG